MKRYTTTCDECGWTSNPCRSEKQAAYARTRHSCDLQRAKDAAAERGRVRHAAVDRTPKDCHHKRTTHVHGTHACYVLDRCRCNHCSAANTAYERTRAKLHAYGRWDGYTDAQPAREHLAMLRAQGMGLRTIAQRSGLSESTLGKIVYGDPARGMAKSKRIRPATEAKILTVTATSVLDLAGGAVIDGTGTRRRLQALVALGWSQSRLGELLGYSARNFGHLIHGKRAVTVRNAIAVRKLYDQLWNMAPTGTGRGLGAGISRSKTYALHQGWAPPMAWDDDTIDDPAAQPNTGDPAASGVNHGKQSSEATADDVQWLLELDPWATRRQISDRLGMSLRAIELALERAGRGDLRQQLTRNQEATA